MKRVLVLAIGVALASAATGRLPMTWPRTLEQEPINVGDADYDPLYPFGFGLRTR